MHRWRRLLDVDEERLWWPLFGLLYAAALVVLWWPRFLPLLDMPNHLAAIAILHRYHDVSWGYQRFYDLQILPVPYLGFYVPVHLLAYILPLEWASKVYLSAYVLAVPLGLRLLARRFGRSTLLPLLAFPLCFNVNFVFGFVTFLGGIAWLLFALVVLEDALAGWTKARAVRLFLVPLGLYFTHVFTWMFFGIAAPLLILCHLAGLRTTARRAAQVAGLLLVSPVCALFGFRVARGAHATVQGKLQFAAKFESWHAILDDWPRKLLALLPGDASLWVVAGLGAVWVALLLSGDPEGADEDDGLGDGLYNHRLALLVGLAGLATLLLPIYQKKPIDIWMIGGRFAPITAMLALLLPHGRVRGLRRLPLFAGVALAVFYSLSLGTHYHRFDARAASFRRIMTKVPRGSSTLTLVLGTNNDPDVDNRAEPLLEFHSYAQLLAGGYDPWALAIGIPMVERKQETLPAPFYAHPQRFKFERHGTYYDYVLTRDEYWDHALFGADGASLAPLVATEGPWRLYRVVEKRSLSPLERSVEVARAEQDGLERERIKEEAEKAAAEAGGER